MSQRYEEAYKYLYNQIVNYKIKPGSSIIEADIASALKISRTPVREALNRLMSDGLVNREDGRGFFATEVTPKDVEDICVLRRTLELTALEEGFGLFRQEELRNIRARIEALDEKCWSEEYYRLDQELHSYIVERCGNQWLIRFQNTLNTLVDRFRRIADFNQGRPAMTRREHLDILDAMLAGDKDESFRRLNYHLRNVETNIKDVYSRFFL